MNKQMKYGLFVSCILCLCLQSFSQVAPHIIDLNRLQNIKSKIQSKDLVFQKAYQIFISDADKLLKYGPVSVVEKTGIPPSGSKHDYMSLAPYHWPDSSKKDGLPYMRKDGQTNPEVKLYKDKEYLPELFGHVFSLSLAHYYSGNKLYADQSIKLIRVWFLDSATRMNPNMNFSQAIKGENTGRGAGLIDGRHLIKVIESIELLNELGAYPEKDLKMMQAWFSEFLKWMQTSKNGKEEMNAPNNHGVWYDALRVSIALFTDQKNLANDIVLNAKKRLDNQMDISGRFPLEMARTTSLHYSLFVVEAFFKIAKMGESTNTDLWNYKGKTGNSLKKAFNEIAPYLTEEKKWDGQQIKPFDFTEGLEVLNMGYRKYDCEKCGIYLEAYFQKHTTNQINKLLF